MLNLTQKLYEQLISIVILFLVVYFLSCFHFAQRNHSPTWSRFGSWQMFTNVSHFHYNLSASALINNQWQEIELEKIFTSKWDSGYRFHRPVFGRTKSRIKILAASICVKLETPSRIRLHTEYWPIIPGIPSETKSNIRSKEILDWDCNTPLLTPYGNQVSQ